MRISVAQALHAVPATLLKGQEIILSGGTARVVEALAISGLLVVGISQLTTFAQSRCLGLSAS